MFLMIACMHRFEVVVVSQESRNPSSGGIIRDLSCAKHRFESASKPYGRGTLYWRALVCCVQSILDERGHLEAAGSSEIVTIILRTRAQLQTQPGTMI